jgi:MFS family permease
MSIAATTSALKEPGRELRIHSVYAKIDRRVALFFCLGFLVAYLDRVNIGFAKLQMLSDLRLSETAYGLGAGLFFVGYILCEVPSNMILMRVGARPWIARIMLTWGLLSGAMLFVHGQGSFYAARFFLGVAEAGFMPGVLYYLAEWYPAHRRAKATALFMIGIPLASIVAGPLSGAILKWLNGSFGLAGWQWLFAIEALPAILLGILTFAVLPKNIASAAWLDEDEKLLLQQELSSPDTAHRPSEFAAAFRDPKVWLIGAVDGALLLGLYTIAFWLPSLLKDAGVHSPLRIGLLSTIPHVAAVIAMVLNGRHSDRVVERRWHIVLPIMIGAAALALSTLAAQSVALTIITLSIANAGILGALPPFWALPSTFLRGAASAAGLALAGSIANIAGFFATSLVGWARGVTHSSTMVVVIFAGCVLASALAMLAIPRDIINAK